MKNIKQQLALITASLLVLISFSCQSIAQESGSAQAIAEEFIEAYDNALFNKDIAAFEELLHEELSLTATITIPNAPLQNASLNKAQYLANLGQSFAMMNNYEMKRENLTYTQLSNAQVQFEDLLTESMQVQNSSINSVSTETMIIVIENGKALLKELRVESSIQIQ